MWSGLTRRQAWFRTKKTSKIAHTRPRPPLPTSSFQHDILIPMCSRGGSCWEGRKSARRQARGAFLEESPGRSACRHPEQPIDCSFDIRTTLSCTAPPVPPTCRATLYVGKSRRGLTSEQPVVVHSGAHSFPQNIWLTVPLHDL